MRSTAAALAVALLAALAFVAPASSDSASKLERRNTLEAAVVREMNRVRAAHGLDPLSVSPASAPRLATIRGRCSRSDSSGTTRPTERRSAIASAATTRIAAGASGPRRGAPREPGAGDRRTADRRGLARVPPAPRDHPLDDLEGRRDRRLLHADRAERVRRRPDHRDHGRLRAAPRQARDGVSRPAGATRRGC